MSWPAIPDLIYTDRVKVRTVTRDTKDRAGGRVSVPGPWSAVTYRCMVAAIGASEPSPDTGQAIVTHCVTADTRLGKVLEQFQWQETGSILTITAVEPAGDADGRIWNHYALEVLDADS